MVWDLYKPSVAVKEFLNCNIVVKRGIFTERFLIQNPKLSTQ